MVCVNIQGSRSYLVIDGAGDGTHRVVTETDFVQVRSVQDTGDDIFCKRYSSRRTMSMLPSMHMAIMGLFLLSICQTYLTVSGAHILMVTLSFRGHVVPLSRLADELALRGHQVSFAVQEDGRSYVNKTNARLVALAASSPEDRTNLLAQISHDPGFFRGLLSLLNDVYLPDTAKLYDSLRRFVERTKPDLLIIDIGAMGAIDVAHAMRIPYVINNPSLIYSFQGAPVHVPAWGSGFSNNMHIWERCLSVVYPRILSVALTSTFMDMNKLRAERNLPLYTTQNSVLAEVPLLTNTAFGLEYPRQLDPWTHMTGPLMPVNKPRLSKPLLEWFDSNTTPVVLVLFGTGAMGHLHTWQIKVLAHALLDSGLRVLWSLKQEQRTALGPVLPNLFKVKSNFQQLAAFSQRNVRIVISPCGLATVQEALYYGKPLLCIPLLGDQLDVAARVTDAAVGISLNKNSFDVQDVSQSLRALYRNESYRYSARRVGKLLRESGGTAKAADVVERTLFFGTKERGNENADSKDGDELRLDGGNQWFQLTQPEHRLPWYKAQQLDIAACVFSVFCLSILLARLVGICMCYSYYRARHAIVNKCILSSKSTSNDGMKIKAE